MSKNIRDHEAPVPEPINLGVCELADHRAKPLLEEMRKKLAVGFGVTVVGPYITLRFKSADGGHTECFMHVLELTNTKILEDIDPDWDK